MVLTVSEVNFVKLYWALHNEENTMNELTIFCCEIGRRLI